MQTPNAQPAEDAIDIQLEAHHAYIGQLEQLVQQQRETIYALQWQVTMVTHSNEFLWHRLARLEHPQATAFIHAHD